MGFLAFLLIGGAVAWSAFWLYPSQSNRKCTSSRLFSLVLSGFLAAALVSYAGQAVGLFQSGQIAEWFTVIVGAWLAGFLMTVVRK